MKILLVSHYFPPHRGGIEIVACNLANSILSVMPEWEVEWFASAPASEGSSHPNLKEKPQQSWNGIEKISGLPSPLWGLHALRELRQAIAAADIVHIHDVLYFANLLAAHWALRINKPFIITQHIGLIPYRNPLLRGVLDALNRGPVKWVLQRASQVVFISPAVAEYFNSFCHFSQPPLYVANGVDGACYSPNGDVLSLPEISATRARGGRVFLFAGRFVEKKGLPFLRQLCEQMPNDLWLFAGHGAENPSNWGLNNVRVMTDLRGTTLAACYRAADLLVLPSYGEGFPLVVQESMACGTPVLISDTTAEGAPDMHEHLLTESLTGATANFRWLNRLQTFMPYTVEQRKALASAAQARWSWTHAAKEYAGIFSACAGIQA